LANKYSVYWKKTGEPVIIGGTAEECTRAMDLTSVDSFWSTWQLIKTGHPNASQKWAIARYEEDYDNYLTFVVRCKECRYTTTDGCGAIYCEKHDIWEVPENGYCYLGERKHK
jgi:hypothetical protein